MSEYGAEHSPDDPVADHVPAGDHRADAPAVSEETGTRYEADGTTQATPEDEERWSSEDEERA